MFLGPLLGRPVDEANVYMHAVHDSEVQKVFNNLNMCFNATNMLNYMKSTGLLETAATDAAFVLAKVREFIPSTFLTSYPNHCWRYNPSVHAGEDPLLVKIEGLTGLAGYLSHQLLKPWSRHLFEAIQSRDSGVYAISDCCKVYTLSLKPLAEL